MYEFFLLGINGRIVGSKKFSEYYCRKKVAIFVVPEKKIVKLKSILTELINDFPNFKVRRVASVSGFVISLSVALGPVARLFTRQMYFFINLRQSWNNVLVANEGVLQDLNFRLAHVDAFNGYPINRPLSSSAVLNLRC